MRRTLTVTFIVFALLVTASGAAGAAPSPSFQLARARAEFERGDYQKVAVSLAPELYPKNKIMNIDELKEAHYLLGCSYFFLNRQDLARQEFTALLFLDPAHDLDPAIDPPSVYAFFQTLKANLAQQLRMMEATRKVDTPPSKEVLIERTVREPAPAISNFVPLGYGQFRNGQKSKGVFFLVAETLTGGTSITLFTYQALKYGVPTRYSGAEASTLTSLHIAQVATGGAFLILYGVGVYDSFVNQRPVLEEKRTERPLTPTSGSTPGSIPSSVPKTSWNIVPLLSPDMLGLGAMGRF